MKITTNTQDYKNLTKLIKKRVKDLRNQRLKDEADAINEFANKRKIEKLFKKSKWIILLSKTYTMTKDAIQAS